MKFDSQNSPSQFSTLGILCDETSGFPDKVGYRNGIGGCFNLFDEKLQHESAILEVLLIVMDSTLEDQYGEKSLSVFHQMIRHLSLIGGSISLLYHPGVFHNPEFSRFLGRYHKLLQICKDEDARLMTALVFCQDNYVVFANRPSQVDCFTAFAKTTVGEAIFNPTLLT